MTLPNSRTNPARPSRRPTRRPASRPAARLAALGAALALTLTGCSAAGSSGDSIVVTTNILGDITAEIVGDQADVTVLMQPNADPHSFAISAQQAADLERAGLVVHNGLGLEEGVQRNVDAAVAEGTPTIAVGEEVDPMTYADGGSQGEQDPHFWTDPQRVRTAVEAITDRVAADVEGVDESAVRANAVRYLGEIDELDTWMQEQFDEIPDSDRTLVTNHHVFGYLAERYDFDVLGAVIPSGTPLASPSPADLEDLAGTIREAGVPAIFADSPETDRLAQVLAEQAGVDVRVEALFSESLTEADGEAPTYVDMMRANTETIADSLAGRP